MQVSLPKNLIRRRRVTRPWLAFTQAVVLANVWLFFKVAGDAIFGGLVGAMIGVVVSLSPGVWLSLGAPLGFVCGFFLGGVTGFVKGIRVLVRDAAEAIQNETR
jgi:hypothetical protein